MLNDMEGGTEGGFSLIADIDGGDEQNNETITGCLPVLPMRNMVMFPGVVMPVSVGRSSSLRLVNEANKKNLNIAVVCQKTAETEEPEFDDLHHTGIAAKVLRVLEMPDRTTTVILQGLQRMRLLDIVEQYPYLKGNVESMPEEQPTLPDRNFEAIVESCKDLAVQYIKSSDMIHPESVFAIRNISNGRAMINFLCANLPLKKDEKMQLLEVESLKQRAYKLLEILSREVQLAEIKMSIQMRAKEDIDQQQREYFLQQQIKTIQDELGTGAEQDAEEFRNKAAEKKWNKEVNDYFLKEVDRLDRLHPQSPDYSTQFNYLQTMIDLPWGEYTKDNYNLKNAERVLNHDHYGLEKVKERILEHLAVLQLKKGDMKSPIICLYGPPGVGKTSLGKSIAAALKRKYIRISLGGVHDESEIRGHRRTYIGAMPGRIIKGMNKAGSSNPVFILDEIDKVNQGNQGDPSSALLEVLDPEQNTAFHDNYLDVDYDLSKVMFVATANSLSTIPQPLLDRMELIEVSGYITEEKIEIAKNYLVPKELEANGFEPKSIKFGKPALEMLVESYTRESGVRQLEKVISKILRKIAYEYARDGELKYPEVRIADIKQLLGPAKYTRDHYQGNDYAGVVTGLAWTPVGGEILFIEASLSPASGKAGGKLTLTGSLGDVMKESAVLAMEYIRAHSKLFRIDPRVFDLWNVHIHVPEGAIPKDGPSAGITMVTALMSAFTQCKVKKNVAMTGEITLRGKVLPVGGIKEKILAAKRAGIKEIILCEENKKDIEEIQEIYLKGLKFHYVADIKDVLPLALTQELVEDALDLLAPIKEGSTAS